MEHVSGRPSVLELMLSQELTAMSVSSLALQLNMEVSRGGSSIDGTLDAEELNKRVMGGVAVTF